MCGFQEHREHTGSLQQVLTQYLVEPSCPDGHRSAWRKGGNTRVSLHPWSLGSDSEDTLAREEGGVGGSCGSCEKKRERILGQNRCREVAADRGVEDLAQVSAVRDQSRPAPPRPAAYWVCVLGHIF